MDDILNEQKQKQIEETATLLEVEKLKKHFIQNDGLFDIFETEKRVRAVDGVSFAVNEGEILGLVGESGCGKTTTGKMIAGLLEPTAGNIYFRGTDITSSESSERKQLRKRIQLVFQDPFSSLNPKKTIGTILQEPLQKHDIVPKSEQAERVDELLNQIGLDSSFRDRYAHELSGGQCQRIGIARALAVDPDLIVADEPVSKLDVSVQAKIINLLEDLQSELDLSIIFIAHDLKVVRHISDRVAVMYLGEIAEIGQKQDIFQTSKHPYTQSLLSSIPNPDTRTKIEDKEILQGEPPDPSTPPQGCKFHPRCPEYIGQVCEQTNPELELVDNQHVSCHLYDDKHDEE